MGRHGGINILHQKSWHVWRLDNRLTVERDELRHAEQEREKRKADEQAAFTSKVAKLRRRALGQSEEQEALSGVGIHRHYEGEGPATSSSSTAPAPSQIQKEPEAGGEGKGKDKTAQSFKYGSVTTSNLKKAELDLDNMLKKRGCLKQKGYWGTGGLGSGPHINLFEEAEMELNQHVEDHQKQIRYTQRNNELAEKSRRRPLSEFDEISAEVPWYMRTPVCLSVAAGEESVKDSSEHPVARSRAKRKERHGHILLHHAQETLHEPSPGPLLLQDSCHSTTAVVKAEKKEKNNGKETVKRSKAAKQEERWKRKLAELEVLRLQRQRREAKERERARGLGPAHAG